jgi:hypothetical protein
MTLRRITSIFLTLGFFINSASADSAFGIEYGGPVPAAAVEREGEKNYYRISPPPKPHSLFEIYTVQATAETGVCFISAVGFDFTNDKYGSKGKEQYEKLSTALSKKYGTHAGAWEEYVGSGVWDEPDQFAYSLYSKDRRHSRWWKPNAENDTEFDYIQLALKGWKDDTTWLVLNYRNNALSEKCEEMTNKGDDDAL